MKIEVAKERGMAYTSVSRTVDRLVSAGYVLKMHPNTPDRYLVLDLERLEWD